jgi:hypothetical protein
MIVPKIIYQTSPRWFVVTKPRGWILTDRTGSPSLSCIERFLRPSLGEKVDLYFPFDLDSRISGLGIGCMDRGMQSQFEKFKRRSEIEFKYRLHARDPLPTNHSDSFRMEVVRQTSGSAIEIDITTCGTLTVRKLETFFQGGVVDFNIHLYHLRFPDPFKPNDSEVSIHVPPIPASQ